MPCLVAVTTTPPLRVTPNTPPKHLVYSTPVLFLSSRVLLNPRLPFPRSLPNCLCASLPRSRSRRLIFLLFTPPPPHRSPSTMAAALSSSCSPASRLCGCVSVGSSPGSSKVSHVQLPHSLRSAEVQALGAVNLAPASVYRRRPLVVCASAAAPVSVPEGACLLPALFCWLVAVPSCESVESTGTCR